jgi:hypothetical protein
MSHGSCEGRSYYNVAHKPAGAIAINQRRAQKSWSISLDLGAQGTPRGGESEGVPKGRPSNEQRARTMFLVSVLRFPLRGRHSQLRVRKPRTGDHGRRTSEEALAVI